MTRTGAYLIALAATLVAGWLVPALATRGLAPTLEDSSLGATNYRGRRVFLGLGVVWAVWAVALFVASGMFDLIASFTDSVYGSVAMLLFDGPLTIGLYAVPLMIVVSAVLFGLVDDVFGTAGDKGFRGHLSALARGRLTTGGLKLLGIGAVAAIYGWHAATARAGLEGISDPAVRIGWWVAATMVIALSANLVNLTDLRPGRALKAYTVLAAVAGTVFVLDVVDRYALFAGEAGMTWTRADTAVSLACMLVALLGPVAAVWHFDLGERGMLGDAGSNAMGAIVGYLLAGALPLPWLAAVAVMLLAANVLSERFSFSAIIEATPPLRALDMLGRAPDAGRDALPDEDGAGTR